MVCLPLVRLVVEVVVMDGLWLLSRVWLLPLQAPAAAAAAAAACVEVGVVLVEVCHHHHVVVVVVVVLVVVGFLSSYQICLHNI